MLKNMLLYATEGFFAPAKICAYLTTLITLNAPYVVYWPIVVLCLAVFIALVNLINTTVKLECSEDENKDE